MLNDLKNRKKVVGIRQVARGINSGKIEIVYLAADASAAYKKKLLDMALVHNINVIESGMANEFKLLCGLDVDACCIGVLK